MTILLRQSIFAIMTVVFLTGTAHAARTAQANDTELRKPRVIYPKETKLNFEGLALQGEVRNPGEFYFQHRPEEKFDSLVKRRKNFHQEMLRDVVLSK